MRCRPERGAGAKPKKPAALPLIVTVREYALSHCDDGNQATGRSVRGNAPKGRIRVEAPARWKSATVNEESQFTPGQAGCSEPRARS